MRVLNITEEGRGGGPLNRIVDVGANLKKKGIETVVLYPKGSSETFQNNLRDKKLEHRPIRLNRLSREKKQLLKYIFNFPFEVLHIRSIIKKEKIDVVHCNGPWQVKGIIAAGFTKAKSVWHLNDTYQPRSIQIMLNFLLRFFADGIIVASSRTFEFYSKNCQELLKKPAVMINAAININKFTPGNVTPDPEIADTPGIKIATLGNINPNKGYDTFVRASHHLSKLTDKKITFFAVGPVLESQKKYYEGLEKICQEHNIENIRFLGFRKDVVEILEAIDIYVCSSDFEASPISVWEALSMGKTVVSTDVGDVKNYFSANHCGAVVPTQDPKALAECLAKLINGKKDLKLVNEKARKFAIEHFSIEHISLLHEHFYKTLLNEDFDYNNNIQQWKNRP